MKWPCVFRGPFIKDQVNPRLYAADPKTPFGAFQRDWRRYHCAEINPYGSESCPYEESDCAIAYLLVAEEALLARKSKVGLFRIIAQKRGWERAENKPLARDRVRTDGQQRRASDLRDGPGTGPDHGSRADVRGWVPGGVPGGGAVGVRRTDDRQVATRGPQRIGDLLRGDGAGPRSRTLGWNERQTTADNDGDTGHPVSPPSPRWLGDQSPSGDSGIHQESE